MVVKYFYTLILLVNIVGCATSAVKEAASDIYDAPLKRVVAYNFAGNRITELCVEGNLYREGIGQYHLTVPKTGLAGICTEMEVRNDNPSCKTFVPTVNIERSGIWFSCPEGLSPVISSIQNDKLDFRITGKKNREIWVKDLKEDKEIVRIHVLSIYDTNAWAYLLYPFSLTFDIVTSPFQLFYELGGGR
jgi:hypothetical protein